MRNAIVNGRPTVQGLSIIDFHLHFRMPHDPLTRSLAGGQFGPKAHAGARSGCEEFEAGRARRSAAVARTSEQWRRSWDFADPESLDQDEGWQVEADRWDAELEQHGIEYATFVTAGGNGAMKDLIVRGSGRFLGMAAISDPFAPHAAQEFEDAVSDGQLRGLKLFAPLSSAALDDPGADPVWEVASKHQVPVLIHFGHCGSAGGIAQNAFSNPASLERVAKAYPEVTFVIPHFGIQHVQEVLFLMWACPNVLVDTSGSNQWVRYMAQRLTLEDLFRRFYETMGPERIIFGSDSSWFPRGFARRYLADQLRICWEMGMPPAHLQQIFGGNAAQVLKLTDWRPASEGPAISGQHWEKERP